MDLPGALGRRSRGRWVSQADDRSGEPSPFQNPFITELYMLPVNFSPLSLTKNNG